MAGSEFETETPAETRVLVIGAGQAGLATAYHLKAAGVAFHIVDANERIGDSWRRRYRSLTLFTLRWMSALPGLTLSGDPDGYGTGAAFADYLQNYAQAKEIPVECGGEVTRLSRGADGCFVAEIRSGGRIRAEKVVIATGGFQQAVIPALAAGFDASVGSLTAARYQSPAGLGPGTVLVVGDGASGRDIAAELAETHSVLLATGRPRKLLPETILGKNSWWWLTRLGLMQASSRSWVGRLMRRADPFPDRDRSIGALQGKGVRIKPRLVAARGTEASFADGSAEQVNCVIWAAGYRDDTDWLDIPGAADGRGFIHDGGVSPVEGLFFVGRPWQHNRASALISGCRENRREDDWIACYRWLTGFLLRGLRRQRADIG